MSSPTVSDELQLQDLLIVVSSLERTGSLASDITSVAAGIVRDMSPTAQLQLQQFGWNGTEFVGSISQTDLRALMMPVNVPVSTCASATPDPTLETKSVTTNELTARCVRSNQQWAPSTAVTLRNAGEFWTWAKKHQLCERKGMVMKNHWLFHDLLGTSIHEDVIKKAVINTRLQKLSYPVTVGLSVDWEVLSDGLPGICSANHYAPRELRPENDDTVDGICYGMPVVERFIPGFSRVQLTIENLTERNLAVWSVYCLVRAILNSTTRDADARLVVHVGGGNPAHWQMIQPRLPSNVRLVIV